MINEHDRQIERYVDGLMSPAEEREFLRLTEQDAGLRRLLEAEQAIVSGTRKERLRMPNATAEPGTALLAKLAATPAATGMAATAGTSGFSLFNATIMPWAIAAVGTFGIVLGAFVVAPLATPEPPALDVSAAPAPPATPRTEAPQPPAAIQPQNSPAAADQAPEQTDGKQTTAAAPATKQPQENNTRKQQKAVTPDAGTTQSFPLDEGNGDRAVFDNDTVRVKTKLNTGKQPE